jgi:SAM-dependent methyltransferase
MESGTYRARWAPLAAALRAFNDGEENARLIVRTDLGTREEWPAALFFRQPDEFTDLERRALELCGQRVIDVGAGAGPHALELRRRGHDVLAVESLPEIAVVLRDRGLERVTLSGLADLPAASADTVLMLMNGLGLAGTLGGLPRLLRSAARLLAPGGNIVADSTDPRYFLEIHPDAPISGQDGRYGGEVQFQIAFDGTSGEPFPFLYVDPETLDQQAVRQGLMLEATIPFDDGTYLAEIRRVADREPLGAEDG